MFHVVDMKSTVYTSSKAYDCWRYITAKLLHPSKQVRTEAKRLHVLKPNGSEAIMPEHVRSLRWL